jgi:hypothetical protein
MKCVYFVLSLVWEGKKSAHSWYGDSTDEINMKETIDGWTGRDA